MKRFSWTILFLLLVVLVVLYLKPHRPQVVEPESTAAPHSDSVFREAMTGRLLRLNPILDYYNPVDRAINRLLFSSLFTFDELGFPRGDLVESWGISQDSSIYNISIRQNVKWHDGRPLTTDDILFTIEMIQADQIPLPSDVKDFWGEIEVVKFDDYNLQFRLPEPFSPFLDFLTFGILPKHLLADLEATDLINDPFNLHPVGSGPYAFDHMIVEDGKPSGVVLTNWAKYYGEKGSIDQLIFRFYPDSQSALNAYKAGEADAISEVSKDIFSEALAQNGLNFYTSRLPELSIIFLNLNDPEHPFFQDLKVREALLTGLNRQWIIDHILEGQAMVAHGSIFPNTWGYYDGVRHVEYDLNAAIKMLKTAGYTIPAEGGEVRAKDGTFLSFNLMVPDDPLHIALAEAIQQDWAKLGVEAILKPIAYDKLISEYLAPREYEAALVDLNFKRSPDPDPYPFWHQTQITGGQNYSQWNDRQASEYLESARVTRDLDERIRLYRNFQVRFAAELPALPLYFPMYTYAVNERVMGVSVGPLFDPSDRFNSLPRWQIQETPRLTEESGDFTLGD